MTPENERYLYEEYQRRVRSGHWGCIAREVINDMVDSGMINHWKQAYRTLEKWENKGWWNCGVSIDCGWLEEPEWTYDERVTRGNYRWQDQLNEEWGQ